MKIVTTLLLLLIGSAAFAQSVSLTIFNNGGQQFFVIMNGIRQNSLPQTNVKIGGMAPGSYEVKLIFADGKTGDVNKKIWIESSGDYLARVKQKRKKNKLQFFGMSDGSQPLPAGGTSINYRPDEQSAYSDQQSQAVNPPVSQPLGNLQQGQVQNPPAGQQTQPIGTVTPPNGSNGTITNTTTVTDPNNPSGQSGVNINVNGSTGSTTTTISDTNNSNGQTTINTNVTIQGSNSTGNTTIPPSIDQHPTTFGSPVTIPDPNIPTGFGIHINADGSVPSGVMSTGTTTTTTASSTINGQTTQTTTIGQDGQAVTNQTTMTVPPANEGDIPESGIYTKPGVVTNSAGTPICSEILSDIDGFINEIQSAQFDADKRELIEFTLANACLTSDQLYRIINALTFENDRLDISKALYLHLTDRNNAGRILELFTFQATKDEFKAYMSSH